MESSSDLNEYKEKLNSWADNHLEIEVNGKKLLVKGREALPEDLQVRDTPCEKK